MPSGGYPIFNYILAGLMIFATFLLGILFLKKRGSIRNWFAQEGFSVLLGLGMLGGLIFIGVGVSIVISPIFVYRYMIPCLGGFWFVFAFLLNDCDKKWIWIPILLLTVYVGRMNVNGVFWEENNKIVQMPNTIEALECIQEDDVMVFNFNHVQAVVGFYKENESYLLYQEAEPLIQEIYRDYGMIEDVTQIKELLQQGKKVWFLGSFVSREDIVEEWKQQGLKITEMGSYLLERYWFNLYEVK